MLAADILNKTAIIDKTQGIGICTLLRSKTLVPRGEFHYSLDMKMQRENQQPHKNLRPTTSVIAWTFVFFLLSVQARAYITPHQFYDPVRHLLVNAANTHWDLSGADQPDGVTASASPSPSHLQFVARAPELTEHSIQATLTMRVDKGEWRSARLYAERWLKDFPKFGYELQMSREAQLGSLSGYDMEFKAKDSPRTTRQFIVKRPGEMWIFTCTGDSAHFRTAWTSCEKILKTASAH